MMCQCQHYKTEHIGNLKIVKGRKRFYLNACVDNCPCYRFRLHTGGGYAMEKDVQNVRAEGK